MIETLQLDKYRVPGFGLTITGEMEIRTEDLSGETSGTARVDKGVKPKKISVATCIRFKEEKELRELVRVAEARNDKGEGKVYTITNRTANVGGVRQVRFTDRINWSPMQGKAAWKVTFTLREYLSVPERVEERTKPVKIVSQKNEGKTVEDPDAKKTAAEPETAAQVAEAASGFEKVLKYVDEALA